MSACRWQKNVEAHFDGEAKHAARVEAHLEACPACAAYARQLAAMRAGAAVAARPGCIADAQFPAFMEGIRERIEAPRRGYRGLWAGLSLAAAAMIIAADRKSVV